MVWDPNAPINTFFSLSHWGMVCIGDWLSGPSTASLILRRKLRILEKLLPCCEKLTMARVCLYCGAIPVAWESFMNTALNECLSSERLLPLALSMFLSSLSRCIDAVLDKSLPLALSLIDRLVAVALQLLRAESYSLAGELFKRTLLGCLRRAVLSQHHVAGTAFFLSFWRALFRDREAVPPDLVSSVLTLTEAGVDAWWTLRDSVRRLRERLRDAEDVHACSSLDGSQEVELALTAVLECSHDAHVAERAESAVALQWEGVLKRCFELTLVRHKPSTSGLQLSSLQGDKLTRILANIVPAFPNRCAEYVMLFTPSSRTAWFHRCSAPSLRRPPLVFGAALIPRLGRDVDPSVISSLFVLWVWDLVDPCVFPEREEYHRVFCAHIVRSDVEFPRGLARTKESLLHVLEGLPTTAVLLGLPQLCFVFEEMLELCKSLTALVDAAERLYLAASTLFEYFAARPAEEHLMLHPHGPELTSLFDKLLIGVYSFVPEAYGSCPPLHR